ncbi:MAG TPA: C25 family cysteine peptidase [Bacteroidales bacterium]|nr:C25 family cysteine peptidase [Bacteroidales bacterium]
MKKYFILLGLFLALDLAVLASRIEQTYTFSNYAFTQKGDYSVITFEDCFLTGIPGEPVLPYCAVKLLLPPGHEAISIEFYGENETMLPGTYRIYPEQNVQPVSRGTSGTFIFNEHIYTKDQNYPEAQYGKLSTEYMNGHSVALSAFTPVMYNPVTGSVSYYQKVTIVLKTRESQVARQALSLLPAGRSGTEFIGQFIQNSQDLASYPSSQQRDESYSYLIITPEQFSQSFEEMRAYYLQCGLESSVITTEYISANYTGQDLQEKIRNCIIGEYTGHGIEYVLLGGDVEHIPYRGFYCTVQSSSVYESEDIPSDLYYSGLDGTWNDNGNGRWGEIGEDDLLPDVAVTRLPFSSQDELTRMLHKVLMYQQEPVTGELRDPLLAGENLYNDPETWGSDYLELLIGHREDNGYTTDGIPEDHNIEKLYAEVSSWGASTLLATINQGTSFVHHAGHANSTYVMYLYNGDITNSNFSQVNGVDHNYTLVYTHGCDCGGFDGNDCILEEMVKIDNFAAAVVGNSRYGWFNEGQTEGPSAHLQREFVDAIYHDKLSRIGRAHMESRIATSPWVNAPGQWEEGALRWCFYDCNVLGETAMPIWTDEPITPDVFYISAVSTGQVAMDVTVTYDGEPLENIRCVVMKEDAFNGIGITGSNGQATINFEEVFTEPGEAQLVISGYNCLTATYPITIIPSEGAYAVYAAHTVGDEGGNGNGIPESGEDIFLSIDIKNVGAQAATNASAVLSTEDPYVTVTDGQEDYGTIQSGEIISIENGFALEIAPDIPDQHTLTFLLTVTAEDSWTSDFTITVNAPNLVMRKLSVDDEEAGNGNGILDPGETAHLLIEVRNLGMAASSAIIGQINTTDPYLEIIDGLFETDSLGPDEIIQATYLVALDPSTPMGTVVGLRSRITSGAYDVIHEYQLATGIITEDFETGDYSRHSWQFGGNSPWLISQENPFEGMYCSRSGEIDDTQTTQMMITAEVLTDDSISFHFRVSSEADYDFLLFYIDDVSVGQWSGQWDWSYTSYPVTAGLHTFKWIYKKDSWLSSGGDCAWIDNISFPPISVPVSVNENPVPGDLSVYPNPFTDRLSIEYTCRQASSSRMMLLNSMGQSVMEKNLSPAVFTDNATLNLDVAALEPGVYYLRIVTETGSWIRKIMKIR